MSRFSTSTQLRRLGQGLRLGRAVRLGQDLGTGRRLERGLGLGRRDASGLGRGRGRGHRRGRGLGRGPTLGRGRGLGRGLALGIGTGMALLLALAAPGTADATPGGRGFHIDLGFGATRLDLGHRIEDSLYRNGIRFDDEAPGGMFSIGYGFSRNLRMDLVLAGYELDTGHRDVYAEYGEARLELVSRLSRRGPVQPYVAGGIGSAILGIGPDNDDVDEVQGSLMSFGGGVELILSRHWSLGFDYRYGLSSFDREKIDLPNGYTEIDGNASSQTWGLRFQLGL